MVAAAADLTRRIALAAVLLAGCQGRHKAAPAPGGVSTSSFNGVAPAQFSDLAPGDTASVIAMMHQIMQQVDRALPQMQRRDTVAVAPGDTVAHRFSLWRDAGVVRKLTVSDTAANLDNAETDVWFVGGDVSIVQEVSDVFAFDNGRIVLWTDETLTPRSGITSAMLMQQETLLINRVRGWAGVFGVTLP